MRDATQEINLPDIDRRRVRGWGSSQEVPTLPEMLAALGADGWEMVSHVVNRDNTANGVTLFINASCGHFSGLSRPLLRQAELGALF